MAERPKELDNRVVILNGFSDQEIIAIMNIVKALYADESLEAFSQFYTSVENHPDMTDFARRLLRVVGAGKQVPETQRVSTQDLIFAKTTENSVNMKLVDLIVDMSGDHAYLKNNPPQREPSPGNGDRS
jgi:hypothetical protein